MNRLNSSHKLSIIYFIFGICYIFLSDYATLVFAGDDLEAYYRMQNYKGVVFFLVSALLVYFTSKKLFASITKANVEQEKALKRYNSLFQATNDAIRDINLETNQCYTSKSLQENFGFTPEAVSNGYSWWTEAIHPADRDRVIAKMEHDLLNGSTIWQEEYRFVCANGEVKTIFDRGIILRDEAGIPFRMIGSMQDVTIQRNLQQAFTDEKIKHRNEMARGVINAQEQERRRIGLELHDNISQLLGVVKLYIENALSDPNNKEEMLKKSSAYLMDVIGEIRQLSKSLSPSALIDIGLIDSIYDLAENMQETKNITVDIDCTQCNERDIPAEKKLVIFRILQDQFRHIAEYSHADTIGIDLSMQAEVITLIIEDNGEGCVGADPEKEKSIENIRHRLEIFNGILEITPAQEKGCRMKVVL